MSIRVHRSWQSISFHSQCAPEEGNDLQNELRANYLELPCMDAGAAGVIACLANNTSIAAMTSFGSFLMVASAKVSW
jgi:hypothetical protein